MNPDEKRVKIAELRGWRDIQDRAFMSAITATPVGIYRDEKGYRTIPDYLNDRNAIIEVWKGLNPLHRFKAAVALKQLVRGEPVRIDGESLLLGKCQVDASDLADCLTATPEQLCDAYLYAKDALGKDGGV